MAKKPLKVTLDINVWKQTGKWYTGCHVTLDSTPPCSIKDREGFWEWIFQAQKNENPTTTEYTGGGVVSFKEYTVSVSCIKQEDEDGVFYQFLRTFN